MRCRGCQSALDASFRFCPGCGLVVDPQASRFLEERLQLLERYLPPALVKHLTSERRAPVGQRAVAAVVFADISGFTAMSERMEPEEVLRVMNGCFEGLVEAVDRHGGTVDKFIGDCLMAVFGVPVAHDDDAVRAVRACVEMYDYLEGYNKTLTAPLGLAVGINYGPLVSGNLGSRTRVDWTVMGDTVNLAQRLEAAAGKGHIYVSAAVEQAAGQLVDFDKLEPIKVKGKQQPVQIYEVKGLKKAARKVDTPLIGRDALLAALDAELPTVRAIDLFAEPGAGTTAICRMLARRWSSSGRRAVMVEPDGETRPFGAVGALVRAVCQVGPDDAAATRTAKVAKLRELGLAEGWRAFLELAAGTGQSLDLDGASLERGMLGAVRALLERLDGALLLLDGAGAYDGATQALIAQLFSQPPPGDLRVVITRHRQALPLVPPCSWCVSRGVPALDRAASDAVAAARLGMGELPASAGAFLYKEAAGNPRYLLELIGSLIDSGYAYQGASGWILRDDLASASASLGLQSLVRSRIDSLPGDRRMLLQTAALYGEQFVADLVAAAVGEPVSGLVWLSQIADRGLLEGGPASYRFAHALVQRCALDGLLTDDRARLSVQLGRAIEAHPEGRKEETLPLLARLFAAGPDVRKACHYLERAGHWLRGRGEHSRAAELFELLAQKLGVKEELPGTAARAWLLAGRGWERAGVFERAAKAFAQAERSAAGGATVALAAEGARLTARLLRTAGRLEQAVASSRDAVAAARQAGQPRQLGWALLEQAEAALAQGRNAEAQAGIEEALAVTGRRDSVEPEDDGSLIGQALGRLGRMALAAGDAQRALGLLSEAVRLCEAAHDHRELVRLYGNLGVLAHKLAKPEARSYFERAVSLARSSGDRLGEAKQLHNLGSFLAARGERDLARRCYDDSCDLARLLGWAEGIAVNTQAIRSLGA